jgi:hypothetical protein
MLVLFFPNKQCCCFLIIFVSYSWSLGFEPSHVPSWPTWQASLQPVDRLYLAIFSCCLLQMSFPVVLTTISRSTLPFGKYPVQISHRGPDVWWTFIASFLVFSRHTGTVPLPLSFQSVIWLYILRYWQCAFVVKNNVKTSVCLVISFFEMWSL